MITDQIKSEIPQLSRIQVNEAVRVHHENLKRSNTRRSQIAAYRRYRIQRVEDAIANLVSHSICTQKAQERHKLQQQTAEEAERARSLIDSWREHMQKQNESQRQIDAEEQAQLELQQRKKARIRELERQRAMNLVEERNIELSIMKEQEVQKLRELEEIVSKERHDASLKAMERMEFRETQRHEKEQLRLEQLKLQTQERALLEVRLDKLRDSVRQNVHATRY
jgi:hypothetical protein